MRTILEIRREVSMLSGTDANTSAMLAHIRGEPIPSNTPFTTGGHLADYLFHLAYEYDCIQKEIP